MNERIRMFILILIMITVSFSAVGVTIRVLYKTAFDEERERLVETAQSQARLIEAVARFDSLYSSNYPEGSVAATLSQIIDAHRYYKGFGETGEFTLARREGENIVFLLSHRHFDLDNPRPIRFDSVLGEPMRLALSGRSGTVIGLDYRGEKVLAAHEPVKELNLGIVAKIDLAEIRGPFVIAGLIAGGFAVLIVFGGAAFFLHISNPIISRLEEQAVQLTTANVKMRHEIKERELAEEALRASRDYLEKLTNSMWDVVFSVKMPERVIEWVNDSSRLMGYEPSECVGKDTAFFYSDKDDFLDFGHKLNNAMAAGKDVFHSEQLLKRKSGETFPAEITVTFHKENDEVVSVTSIVRDITERKLAEEALKKAHDELEQRVEERTTELETANKLLMDEISERKKSEKTLKRYEDLLEHTQQISKVGGWEIDVETGTPSFTSEVFRIYEIDTADVPAVEEGMNYYVPEHRPVIAEAVDRAISQGEPYDLELRLITAKNNRRWVRTIGIPRQEDGKTVILSGVIQDITERKRIEEALRESEEHYRTVVQDQTELISRFREDGTFTYVNEVYCRFFNKPYEELIGNQWQPVAFPEDLPVIEEKLALMSVENPIVLIENRVVSGSGEIRWMQFVNRGFFDEEEQLIEIQSVGRDITELKLVEEALKISEMTLRQTSSRRLDAFEDERKRIGLELHDGLAQTMSAIKIWAKSAARMHLNQNNEAKVAESLENVVSLSQRAIEELRRVSKNLHPAVLENLGLLAAIDWLCEETEQLDRSINITRQIDVIENEVPDSLKTVIFRVTQEALNNVFRHSKANLVRISLQKAEREIKLIIEDDGSGFESGPQNLYQKTGHGLGLISMEERTKLAGGTFSIESQLWEGTTIKAVWPL